MLCMVAACGGAQRATGATASGTTTTDASGDTRGMDVKPSLPAIASAMPEGDRGQPFVLETKLRARRLNNAFPVTLDDVRSGETLMDGDRLQVTVRTSTDAYLYLAFCSQSGSSPRYHGLSVFPPVGAIPLAANVLAFAPAPPDEIVLDNKPGPETLYLIFSRTELPRADSGLAAAIAAARQGRETTDCGARLRGATATTLKAGSQSWSGGRPAPPDPGAPGLASEHSPSPDRMASRGKPVVEIERGGGVVWSGGSPAGVAADPDGIVILRYDFKHVAAAR
jgi:hypothetical protein